ncbi:hypothetical protein Nepgr_003354 [Nepenthes gracilis]|uniref:Uncharacterized protein n=1 Tax=Nepenthes gracilis TaxID=150966 RepID=A0AAD3XDP6_NEPGR|nr:hypothetical protein Nepgr_003354 [Nepenthes gracilis]
MHFELPASQEMVGVKLKGRYFLFIDDKIDRISREVLKVGCTIEEAASHFRYGWSDGNMKRSIGMNLLEQRELFCLEAY